MHYDVYFHEVIISKLVDKYSIEEIIIEKVPTPLWMQGLYYFKDRLSYPSDFGRRRKVLSYKIIHGPKAGQTTSKNNGIFHNFLLL
jgi:hypothetical protein